MGNRGVLRRWLIATLLSLLVLPLSTLAQTKKQKIVILMLGAPGSGKTTQAANLGRKYKVPVYSMSTILKKETGWSKSKLKEGVRGSMSTGDFVNDELANQLIEKYITRKKALSGFVLDGYPRSKKQAEYFEDTLRGLGLPQPAVIHLRVPDEVARQRLTARGGKQDTPELIDLRMEDYHAEAKFLMSHYEGRLAGVDGTRSRGEVWSAIQSGVAKFE